MVNYGWLWLDYGLWLIMGKATQGYSSDEVQVQQFAQTIRNPNMRKQLHDKLMNTYERGVHVFVDTMNRRFHVRLSRDTRPQLTNTNNSKPNDSSCCVTANAQPVGPRNASLEAETARVRLVIVLTLLLRTCWFTYIFCFRLFLSLTHTGVTVLTRSMTRNPNLNTRVDSDLFLGIIGIDSCHNNKISIMNS